MSLILNEEQTLLKHTAREFFRAKAPIKALRILRDEKDSLGFDRALWKEIAALGWAGILIPENYGGVGFGYQGLGQILEESGRTLAASPLTATVLLAAPLILAAGSEAQKQRLLPAVASGDTLLTLALDERPRHAPCHITTTAAKTASGFVLNGRKIFVLDGHVAEHLIVIARTSEPVTAVAGLSGFLVAANTSGITIERTFMVDGRNAANVVFENVALPGDALLGPLDHIFPLLEPVLDAARVGLAAEMLGSGLEAFERTVAYLKLRTQFGVPIGSFQALKHRAALMYCELELTTSAVLEALTALDEQRADINALASLAKAKACEMLELVTSEGVQLHGGIGMTDAEEIGFFLKRARVAQQLFGDASFHRDRYAALMGF
jgi:alkylation response protein AidB-like acyl-CoA dehydrogenase